MESTPQPVPANGVGHKPRSAHKKAAALIAQGKPIKHALLEAGYSLGTAKKGKKAINQQIMAELTKHGLQFRDLGYQMLSNPKDIEATAVGRLAYNAITGSDQGFQSAKQLGAHRSVNAWAAENVANVVVIQPPEHLIGRVINKLEAMVGTAPTDDDK